MHTRTGHTIAFTGHHLDKLSRSLACLSVCTQQCDVLLRKVGHLDRIQASILIFFQVDLHRIDHTACLCKSMCLTYGVTQDGERLCLFDLDIHTGQHGTDLFERERKIHTGVHLHFFPLLPRTGRRTRSWHPDISPSRSGR